MVPAAQYGAEFLVLWLISILFWKDTTIVSAEIKSRIDAVLDAHNPHSTSATIHLSQGTPLIPWHLKGLGGEIRGKFWNILHDPYPSSYFIMRGHCRPHLSHITISVFISYATPLTRQSNGTDALHTSP
jgi:hypothetical protein